MGFLKKKTIEKQEVPDIQLKEFEEEIKEPKEEVVEEKKEEVNEESKEESKEEAKVETSEQDEKVLDEEMLLVMLKNIDSRITNIESWIFRVRGL